jgi:hypothetical protein
MTNSEVGRAVDTPLLAGVATTAAKAASAAVKRTISPAMRDVRFIFITSL